MFIHRYDPVIVFYGGGIRHLFEREFNGVLFSPGEQILYQFGVGFSVNDRVTLSTAFQGFYITYTQLDNVTVPGTNLEPISLRFAATIAENAGSSSRSWRSVRPVRCRRSISGWSSPFTSRNAECCQRRRRPCRA